MKQHLLALVTMSVAICLSSCGGKKEKTDIVARKPIVVRATETRAMGDHSESRKVEWIGASYTIDTQFKADKSLPLINDGEQKYYDNRATVKILRKDGLPLRMPYIAAVAANDRRIGGKEPCKVERRAKHTTRRNRHHNAA